MAWSTVGYKKINTQGGSAVYSLTVQGDYSVNASNSTATVYGRLIMNSTWSVPYYGWSHSTTFLIGGASYGGTANLPSSSGQWSSAYGMSVGGKSYGYGVLLGSWSRTFSLTSSSKWIGLEGRYTVTESASYLPAYGNPHSASGGVTIPAAGYPSGSISVGVNTRTAARLDGNVSSWGANASGSSATIGYSTTAGSYGNTATSGVNFAVNPNTTYYYRYRIINTAGLTSDYTGSFTTPGNAPTITSASNTAVTTTTATMTYAATFDTNASLSSRKWEYGTTTSYGSQVTNTNSITGLQPNTTYYWRLTVTDSWNRTSSGYTGSFITHPNTVQISNVEVTNAAEESIEYTITFPTPSLVNLIECILYEADGTTLKETKNITTGIVSPYIVMFEDLTPNATYILKTRIRTVRSNAYSTQVVVEGGTVDTRFLYVLDSTIGEPVAKKAYILGKANLLNGNMEAYSQGSLTPVVGQSLTNILDRETLLSDVINTRYVGVLAGTQYTFDFTSGTDFTAKVVQFNESLNCTAFNTYTPGSYTLTTNANTSFVLIGYVQNVGSTLNPTTAKDYFKDVELYKTSQKKAMLKNDVVKISGLMRYIDIGQSGNSVNSRSHIVQIQAFDVMGNEVAFEKEVSIIKGVPSTDPLHDNPQLIVDGDFDPESFLSIAGESASNRDTLVRVDLGEEYEIDYVVLWRYWVDNRVYHKTFLYGRRENTELCWKFHDWKNEGVYHETPEGYTGNVKYQIWRTAPVINNVTLDTASGVPNTNGTLLTVDATEIATGIPVIDRLNSIRRDAFLSANQGRLLKTYIGSLDSLTTKTKVNIVAAINELLNDFTGLSGYSNIIEAILEAPFTK